MKPMFELHRRALRTEMRSPGAYIAGSLICAFLVLDLWTEMFDGTSSEPPGFRFFQWMLWLDFFFVTLAGIGYFSSVIAEEKEEATLGLLCLTGLTPLSILLGKSMSRFVAALLVLLAQIPLAFLAEALGGLSAQPIVAAYLTIIAYLFLVGNAALFASVVSRSIWHAALLTLILVLFLNWGGDGIRGILELIDFRRDMTLLENIADCLLATSPRHHLSAVFQSSFSDPLRGWQPLWSVVAGLGFFLLAWVSFSRAMDGETSLRTRRSTLLSRLRWLRPGRTWRNAILWKDFYFMHGGVIGLLSTLALSGGLVALGSLFINDRPRSWLQIFSIGFCLCCAFLLLQLSFSAARAFREEIEAKTHSNLATLPIPVNRLIAQKFAAAFLSSVPAFGWVVFAGVYVARHTFAGASAGHIAVFSLVVLFSILDVIGFLFFLMLLSLFMRRGSFAAAAGIYIPANLIGGVFVGAIFDSVPYEESALPPLVLILAAILFIRMLFVLIRGVIESALLAE